MLESQDIKLWQTVETETLISRDVSLPLTLADRRKGGKKMRLWMMGQKKVTGRMSERDNGRQGSRKMRGERFITPPVVWATSASDQTLRLCFLWKLNDCRGPGPLEDEDWNPSQRREEEAPALPSQQNSVQIFALSRLHSFFFFFDSVTVGSAHSDCHPSKEMSDSCSVTSLSMIIIVLLFWQNTVEHG